MANSTVSVAKPAGPGALLRDPKALGAIAFAIVGLLISLTQPFTGLAPQGQNMLAILCVALGLWIFRPGGVPFMAGCSIIIAGGLYIGLKYDAVVSGFLSPATWVLIPALYFGFVFVLVPDPVPIFCI